MYSRGKWECLGGILYIAKRISSEYVAEVNGSALEEYYLAKSIGRGYIAQGIGRALEE
jgi:hypothetical protein